MVNWLLIVLTVVLLPSRNQHAKAENVTLCWGFGSSGQLGNGQGDVTSSDFNGYNSSSPVQVLGGHSFATVCSGSSHSCALEPSGKAWCWGENNYGALGTGTASSGVEFSSPVYAGSATPVEVAGGHNFRSISCGYMHTCGLDTGGKAWCWGDSPSGQLGTENNTITNTPVEAAAGRLFKSLLACGYHTCGIAELGRTFCWGMGRYRQLGGIRPEDNQYAVVEVVGSHTFQSVSCGQYHSCTLNDQGQAFCWGRGTNGRLGNGVDDIQSAPVPVSGGQTFTSIAVGGWHTCAIDRNASLWCWGKSPGNGQSSDTGAPTKVSDTIKFAAIGTGDEFSCGLDTTGGVWCFGNNKYGQLGDGSVSSSSNPVRVTGGHTFISIGQAGKFYTCAIATRQGDTGPSSPVVAASPVPAAASPAPASPSPSPSPAAPSPSPSSAAPSPSPSPAAPSSSPSPAGAPSPSPLPAPTVQAPPTVSTASSSAPIGAIVGGVAAAVAALAVLGFFALRPSKGWLRRRPTAAAAVEDGKSVPPAYAQASKAAPTAPAAAPLSSALGAVWSSGNAHPGPWPLPPSCVSSSGLGSGPLASGPAVAGAAWTASHSSSAHSSASDPVLAFVSTNIASQPRPDPRQRQPSALARGSSGGSIGAFELRTDARVWEVQWAELTVQRLLGRGSFGSVYLAEWNQVPVAVKVLISKDDLDRGQLQLPERVLHELQAEAAVLRHMRHPNIVQFMGLVALPPALITEYCSRGSLYDCLAAAHEQPAAAAQLTWRRRLGMAVDAGAGLLYLHRRSIIHRDIKSPNLLVDEHWRVKVADFNLSKLLEGARPEASLASAAATNPIWLAPEVLEGGSATAASDVYSFGMVLFELLTWRLPWTFASMTPFKVGATIRQGGRPEVPPRQALPGPDTAAWAGLDAYVQLMRDCWAPRPVERPSFDQVVSQLRRLLADTAGG